MTADEMRELTSTLWKIESALENIKKLLAEIEYNTRQPR